MEGSLWVDLYRTRIKGWNACRCTQRQGGRAGMLATLEGRLLATDGADRPFFIFPASKHAGDRKPGQLFHLERFFTIDYLEE
jgi:hypothetical protein